MGIQYRDKGEVFVLSNIYAPNEDTPAFFVEVFKLLDKYKGRRIITGDFNLVLDVDIDRTDNSKSNNDKSAGVVDSYMEDTLMCDIWRVRNPESRQYTYTRKVKRGKGYIGSRLDMFLVEIACASWITSVKMYPRYKTDHAALVIEILPFEISRGRGFWKLNNKVLYEQEYIEMINKEIENITKVDYANPQDKWEALKIRVIANSQVYCSERSQNRKLVIRQLEEYIEKMQQKELNEMNDIEQDILNRTITDLESLKDEQMQGTIFRSGARFYNEGEAATKYFYNLEKSKSGAKSMSSLLTKSGEETRDPSKILNEQFKFYKKLYTSEEVDCFDFENRQNLVVPKDIKQSMEGLFMMDELKKAIKEMKRNKSPGIDGLTCEFYAIFVTKIGALLLTAVNYAFTAGRLHDSSMRAVISLIPKKLKDTRKLENLRPISLLCVDYKLVEKMLANRIKPALDFIVHSDQKGFLAGRRISCNIRRILDAIDLAEKEDLPIIIASIDFMKCFDRIETNAIIEALHYFSFGEDFINWTKIIYNRPQACVVNNGYLSKYMTIERGVRQGGPCSTYYFLVIAELLAIEIRSNKDLKGIMIDNITKLLGQYADDIDLYLFGEEKNLQKAFQIIEHFSTRTGFKINYDKTTIYRIGSLKNSQATYYTKNKLQWGSNDGSINVLGVQVTHDKKILNEINYKSLVQKAASILQSWKR